MDIDPAKKWTGAEWLVGVTEFVVDWEIDAVAFKKTHGNLSFRSRKLLKENLLCISNYFKTGGRHIIKRRRKKQVNFMHFGGGSGCMKNVETIGFVKFGDTLILKRHNPFPKNKFKKKSQIWPTKRIFSMAKALTSSNPKIARRGVWRNKQMN